MSFPRPIEWEIRGLVLVSGRPTDSTLGTGVGRTEQEAIANWRQRRPEWREKASCVHAIPAPIFRTRSLLATVCALVSAASLVWFAEPTVGPSWASDGRNTRVDDTPSPQASVGAGAISPAVGGNQTDLRAKRGLREETGYRVAVPACNRNDNDNRHSHAMVGCVQSTLEAPDSAQAGGRPAPLSTPGAPRESLRTPHCPPVRT